MIASVDIFHPNPFLIPEERFSSGKKKKKVVAKRQWK